MPIPFRLTRRVRLALAGAGAALLLALQATSALAAGPDWNEPRFQAQRLADIYRCRAQGDKGACARVVWYGLQAAWQIVDPPPVY